MGIATRREYAVNTGANRVIAGSYGGRPPEFMDKLMDMHQGLFSVLLVALRFGGTIIRAFEYVSGPTTAPHG
jgi:hypothetical protein